MHHALVDGTAVDVELDREPLGRGGEGNVYRVANLSGRVAKIYHPREGAGHASRAKLEAMIASPPQHLTVRFEGRQLVQFAWPSSVVEDDRGACTGFLMPEVPLQSAVSFETFMTRDSMQRALSTEDQTLPRRLAICRNLAAALAELHRQNHYFVDIKPQNIYLYKDTGVVCLIDTDSFAIAAPDGSRFPASAYTAEYIAPELLRGDVPAREVKDDRQDCYALAVLMFRVLDHGLHPFQGIPADDTDTSEWNIDHSVMKGYYPHGRESNPASTRPPASTSDLWDERTMALFGRAFGRNGPRDRPSAAEWRDHFDALLERKPLVRCSLDADDMLHIHFAGAACPACRLEDLDARYSNPVPPPPVFEPALKAQVPPPASGAPFASAAPVTNAVPAGGAPASLKGVRGWLLFLCLVLTVFSPLMSIFALLKEYADVAPVLDQIPGLTTALFAEFVLGVALMALGVHAGIALWRVRPRAVQISRWYMYLSLGSVVVVLALPFIAGLPSEVTHAIWQESIKEVWKSVLGPVVWLLYLARSERVRATYADATDP